MKTENEPLGSYSLSDECQECGFVHNPHEGCIQQDFECLPEPIQTDDIPYDGGGWPGDGSGTDDFEDMNQNESMDYSDE